MPDAQLDAGGVSNVAAGLFSTASTTVYSDVTNDVAQTPTLWVQFNSPNLNTANVNLSLMGAENNSLTFEMESPQALALASDTVQSSLALQAKQNDSIMGLAFQSEENARQLVRASTATASDQGSKFILVLGVLVIVALAVWGFFTRKREKS